jgi:hypothetical protein
MYIELAFQLRTRLLNAAMLCLAHDSPERAPRFGDIGVLIINGIGGDLPADRF